MRDDIKPTDLTTDERSHIKRALKLALYMKFNNYAKIQDNNPVHWIDRLGDDLELHYDMNPEVAVSFIGGRAWQDNSRHNGWLGDCQPHSKNADWRAKVLQHLIACLCTSNICVAWSYGHVPVHTWCSCAVAMAALHQHR